MRKVFLKLYRSVSEQEFDVAPFTVLFGRNNAGKTNLLEAMYGVLSSRAHPAGTETAGGWRGQGDPDLVTTGVVYVDLEPGSAFDDSVVANIPLFDSMFDGAARHSELPTKQVCFAKTYEEPELWFVDTAQYLEQSGNDWRFHSMEGVMEDVDAQARSLDGPWLRPLFLNLEFDDVDHLATAAFANILGDYSPWCIPTTWLTHGPGDIADLSDPTTAWQIQPEVLGQLRRLETLATSLLPDFIDGAVRARFDFPTRWGSSPSIRVWFDEREGGEDRSFGDMGRGVSRWLTAAIKIALQIMTDDVHDTSSVVSESKSFSGHVLFVDEPEAHLHNSAVASVVRWCRWLVRCGFSVVAASHHEEFLRSWGDDVALVKVTRDVAFGTTARTINGTIAPVLQEMAVEVGLHPATALSLRRAVLFVEGPLDIAVLDEFAGAELDAAGILIVPIHGTKNLEGLVDGEFASRLGLPTGILTDNTVTSTIKDRPSGKKRTGEEKKVLRLLQALDDEGRPTPDWFGVAEDDLLFALPADGIRKCYGDTASEFPGWIELREECRDAIGASKSDSVDWKRYALEHYGLPIDTVDGVRRVVRKLDLAGVPLPSIRTLVDEIVAWEPRPTTLLPWG